MPELDLVPLRGSERAELPHARPAGELDQNARITVTVMVRRRAAVPERLITGPETLTSAELSQRYGADPADVERVTEVLGRFGLTVDQPHRGSRRLKVTGTISQLSEAFGTALTLVVSGTVTHRYRSGGLAVPAELSGVVTAVLGLDDRPVGRPHAERPSARTVAPQTVAPDTMAPDTMAPDAKKKRATPQPLTAVQVASFYNFPPNTDGTGQTIAIIELGGGYRQPDLDTYFSGLGLATPSITAVGVDGASNSPGQAADGEVELNIQVAGAVAPGAALVVYFAPNTDAGFVDAIAEAAIATPTPAVISVSWGAPEKAWSDQSRSSMDSALVDAAVLGVTVTVAAGDNGSSDDPNNAKSVNVDFPASSPHALSCGGTQLIGDTSTNTITSEVVWNGLAQNMGAGGGGVSVVFPLPDYQANAGVPASADGGASGRGVPDVAGNADPTTGYLVVVDGQHQPIGGTSAVAPLWAGLIARLVQATGKRFGLLQPLIYAGVTAGTPAPGFNDVTSGNNGGYQASTGWDPCTGLGSPNGPALLALLAAVTDQGSGRPEARATSDRWTVVDELGYNVYADALADFILNPETPTPLAISIKGEWGTGKTSLMRMLRKRIDPLSPDGEDPVRNDKGKTKPPTNGDVLGQLEKPAERRSLLADRSTQDRSAPTRRPEQPDRPRRSGLPSIWFNAWIYQSSRQLSAGLAVAIINGVASRMSLIERERFWLTLQIRRIDGATLRRRLYRELAQRVLPKAVTLLIVSLGGLVAWALHSTLRFPTPATVGAGTLFFVPLVAIPVTAWHDRRKFLEDSLASAFSDLIREPDYTTEAGFLHLYHRDMKLILEAAGVTEENPLVIFVDDLDRCSFGTVAEVVEGLNLFLAGQFPHCIFVIGMEPTLVAAQLAVAYKDLFGTLSDDDSAAARIRYGWRFLEKMVQLPVALPAPRTARLDRYVGSLTSYSANGDSLAAAEAAEPAEAEIDQHAQALAKELDRRGGGIADIAATALALDASLGAAANRPVRASVVAAARRVVSSRANEDDPAVRQMYLNYAGQLSGNPREFKRFLNLFRFYANLQITRELSPSQSPAPSLEQLAKITMLVVRWPDLIREFTGQSETVSAVATLELLAGKHRTVAAWSSAAKREKSLANAACAALLRTDIHSFLRQGPPIADYADELI